MEIAIVILLLVLCILVVLEINGYMAYLKAEKNRIEIYERNVFAFNAVVTALQKMEEDHKTLSEEIESLQSDNDILRSILTVVLETNGLRLPHLEEKLHNHN